MSEGTSIASVLTGLPRYLLDYFIGFVVVVATDTTMTSLGLGSIALGFALGSAWIGLAAFFLGHTAISIVNAITGAHIQHARIASQPLRAIAAAFHNQGQPPITEPPTEA